MISGVCSCNVSSPIGNSAFLFFSLVSSTKRHFLQAISLSHRGRNGPSFPSLFCLVVVGLGSPLPPSQSTNQIFISQPRRLARNTVKPGGPSRLFRYFPILPWQFSEIGRIFYGSCGEQKHVRIFVISPVK